MSDLAPIRRVGAPVVIAAIAIALTGCTGPAADLPAGTIDADAAVMEYRDESANWDLPEEVEWPAELTYSSAEPSGLPHYYEEGIGRVDATLFWYCAWGDEFLTRTPGSDRDHALTQLLLLETTALYQQGFPPEEKDLFDGVSDDLVAGDYTFFTQFVSNTCQEVLVGSTTR